MKMGWPGLEQSKADAVPLRRDRRDSMFLKSAVVCDRIGPAFSVVVRNVSAGGLLADSEAALDVGDQVRVTLRNVGAITGRIVWVQSGRFGMSFDRTIDPQLARKPVPQRAVPAPGARQKQPPMLFHPLKGRGRRPAS